MLDNVYQIHPECKWSDLKNRIKVAFDTRSNLTLSITDQINNVDTSQLVFPGRPVLHLGDFKSPWGRLGNGIYQLIFVVCMAFKYRFNLSLERQDLRYYSMMCSHLPKSNPGQNRYEITELEQGQLIKEYTELPQDWILDSNTFIQINGFFKLS